jgi:hypothetical protein
LRLVIVGIALDHLHNILNLETNYLLLIAGTTNTITVNGDNAWKSFVFLVVNFKTLFDKVLNNP